LQNRTHQNINDLNEQNNQERFSTAQNQIDSQPNPFENNLMSIEHNNESNDSIQNENELSRGKSYLGFFFLYN
jgi:hypothetical protein